MVLDNVMNHEKLSGFLKLLSALVRCVISSSITEGQRISSNNAHFETVELYLHVLKLLNLFQLWVELVSVVHILGYQFHFDALVVSIFCEPNFGRLTLTINSRQRIVNLNLSSLWQWTVKVFRNMHYKIVWIKQSTELPWYHGLYSL